MVNKLLLKKAFDARGGAFEDWYDENVVEFDCMDCGEHIVRARHEIDIDGLTPVRCGKCTLDRMAES